MQYLGTELDQRLREIANSIRKWKKWEKDEMYAHYKAELKRLQAMRKDGVRGYIEVVSYD